MSEADRLFEELGYKKSLTEVDNIKYYKDDDNVFFFVTTHKTFHKTGEYDGMCDAITMQELQTINMKVKELRLDMILMLVILNYINDCKKIGKEKLAVSLSGRLFSYFLCVPLPIFAGLILIEVI